MRKGLVAFTIGIAFAAAGLAAKGKDRYLVIAPHTAEQCLAVLDDINEHQTALLEKIDWGCAAGDSPAVHARGVKVSTVGAYAFLPHLERGERCPTWPP